MNINEVLSNESVKLSDIFNNMDSNICRTKNCIYLIWNTETNKGYVGETSESISDRFTKRSGTSHIEGYKDHSNKRYIYNSIRKHTPDKFLVIILESGFKTTSERKSSEIKWIHDLKTYYTESGYNMTFGGDDTSSMERKRKSLWPDTNGSPPSSIKKWTDGGQKRLKELYPNTNGAPTNLINYPFSKDELIKRSRSSALTRLISSYKSSLDELNSLGLQVSIDNLIEHTHLRYCGYRGWKKILNRIDDLIADKRLNEDQVKLLKLARDQI